MKLARKLFAALALVVAVATAQLPGGSSGGGAMMADHPPAWLPPVPAWDVQPWELTPSGGGLPPQPMVYHSNTQKYPPSMAVGGAFPLAAAHSYPHPTSPYLKPAWSPGYAAPPPFGPVSSNPNPLLAAGASLGSPAHSDAALAAVHPSLHPLTQHFAPPATPAGLPALPNALPHAGWALLQLNWHARMAAHAAALPYVWPAPSAEAVRQQALQVRAATEARLQQFRAIADAARREVRQL